MGEEVKALFDGCSKVCHIAPSTASEPAVQTVPQLSNIVLSGRMELARRDQVYGQQVQHADTVTDLHTHTCAYPLPNGHRCQSASECTD